MYSDDKNNEQIGGFALAMLGGVIAAIGGNTVLGCAIIAMSTCGFLGRAVAIPSRRRLGGIVGFLLGPIGVIVAAVLQKDNS